MLIILLELLSGFVPISWREVMLLICRPTASGDRSHRGPLTQSDESGLRFYTSGFL